MGLLEWLDGKKTYLSAGFGIIIVLLYLFGIIEENQMLILLSLCGFSGLASLRAGIKKLTN